MAKCSGDPISAIGNKAGASDSGDSQRFPTAGILFRNMGASKQTLSRRLKPYASELVYAYVINTLSLDPRGQLVQEGSGPNIEGGFITLCTCKHLMRTFLSRRHGGRMCGSRGSAGARCQPGENNTLFYLMRIGWAFESHQALWQDGSLTVKAKETKCSDKNPLGDIYRPRVDNTHEFSPLAYEKPSVGHAHRKTESETEWHKDIDYTKGARRPALLVGDPALSFLCAKHPKSAQSNYSPATAES